MNNQKHANGNHKTSFLVDQISTKINNTSKDKAISDTVGGKVNGTALMESQLVIWINNLKIFRSSDSVIHSENIFGKKNFFYPFNKHLIECLLHSSY